MDTRNVLIAVVLSTLTLIVWSTFFEQVPVQKTENETIKNEETSSPSIEEIEDLKKTSRSESINSVDRIKLENENIKGSISLTGAIIDDIIFKNYNETLKSEKKIIFLNPKSSKEGYYIETGWASTGDKKLKLPLDNTVWKVKGNKLLRNDLINAAGIKLSINKYRWSPPLLDSIGIKGSL